MYITIAKLCLFIEEQVQVHKQNLSDSCLTCKQLGMDDYGEVFFFLLCLYGLYVGINHSKPWKKILLIQCMMFIHLRS